MTRAKHERSGFPVPTFEISADQYRGLMSEAEWQAVIVDQATFYGWTVLMEIPDVGLAGLGAMIARGKRGEIARFPLKALLNLLTAISGWPDLTLGHTGWGRTICVEVKTEKGTVRPNQKAVLAILPRCGIPSYVWRPRHADEVERVLRGEA
jgi:hypothetical protein